MPRKNANGNKSKYSKYALNPIINTSSLFYTLPNEIILYILSKCNCKCIISLSITCKKIFNLCNDELLWKNKLINEYPDYYLYNYPSHATFRDIFLNINYGYINKIITIKSYFGTYNDFDSDDDFDTHDECEIIILPSGNCLDITNFDGHHPELYTFINLNEKFMGCTNDKALLKYWDRLNGYEYSMYQKEILNKTCELIDVYVGQDLINIFPISPEIVLSKLNLVCQNENVTGDPKSNEQIKNMIKEIVNIINHVA